MRKLSIIIPVYNERNTITTIIRAVEQSPLPGIEKEIIVVDDCSVDGTRTVLKEFENRHRIVYHAHNQGKGGAIKTGFQHVTGDYVLIQDADLEYDPNDYATLMQPILEKRSSVVFGSRTLQKNNVPFSAVYFYGGLFVSKIFNNLFGSKLSDIATCYKVFPARFIPHFGNFQKNDFVFDVVNITYVLHKNADIVEVPIHYHARTRKFGKKLNWRHGVRCVLEMFRIKLHEII